MVKKEIALAFCTPSLMLTSDTASDSPPTIRLTTKVQRPFAGYSEFISANRSRPRIRSFDCGHSSTKSSASTAPTEKKSLLAMSRQNSRTTSTASRS